jgi:hypothetical protein
MQCDGTEILENGNQLGFVRFLIGSLLGKIYSFALAISLRFHDNKVLWMHHVRSGFKQDRRFHNSVNFGWRVAVNSGNFLPASSTWRNTLLSFPIPVRERWGEIANRYEASGCDWKESEWKAFRFIVDDMSHWEREHPDLEIKFVEPPKENEILKSEYELNHDSFACPRPEVIQKWREEFEAAESLADKQTAIDKSAKDIASLPVLALEKRAVKQISSKPKREPKVKAEKKSAQKKSRHDPGVGSLFS